MVGLLLSLVFGVAAPPVAAQAAVAAAVTTPGAYVPVPLSKVVDTRAGVGSAKTPIAASGTFTAQIGGKSGVPGTGVSAVTLSIAAVAPTGSGWLTAFPAGSVKPNTASLNWIAGRSAVATVTIAVSATGQVSLFNGSAKPVDLVVDVEGYYIGGTVTLPGGFVPVTPSRSLDTRTGVGAPHSAWVQDNNTDSQILSWQVAGRNGIPSSGVVAVVMSVTVTNATGPGQFTAFEDQSTNPALEFNWDWTTPIVGMPFEAGVPVTNLFVVSLSSAGKAKISNLFAPGIDVMADVVGYYKGGGTTAVGTFQPTPPSAVGTVSVNPNAVTTVAVDAPASSTVLLTVDSNASDWGSLYLYEHGTARPASAQAKLGPGRRSMATVQVKVSAAATIDIYNQSAVAVAVSLEQYGYFRGVAPTARTVWAWGANDTGELAHGYTSVGSSVPAPVLALGGVKAVAGVDRSGYAIRNDGSLWAWGKNSNDDDIFQGGQLGDNSSGDRHTPVKVLNLVNVVQVAVDYELAYALQADGTVWTWGDGTPINPADPTDIRTARAPVKVAGLTSVVSISAARLAVRGDGTVWTFGGAPGSVAKVAGVSGIKAVDGTTLLRIDGRVQVGVSILPGLSAITTVSGNYALKSDQTLWTLAGAKVAGISGVTKIGGSFPQYAVTSDGFLWQLNAALAPKKVANLPRVVDVAGSAGIAMFVISA